MYAYRTIAGLQEWLNNASVGKRPPPSPIELSLARSGSQPEVSWVLNWRNWRQRCSTRPIFSETSPTVKYREICGWSSKIFLISEQTLQKDQKIFLWQFFSHTWQFGSIHYMSKVVCTFQQVYKVGNHQYLVKIGLCASSLKVCYQLE